MSGVVLGFGAALAWGVVDAAIAVLTRRASPLSVVLAVHVAGVAMLAVLAAALGEDAAVEPLVWAGVLALCPIAGLTYLVFYRALALGPIAIVSPIASANGVVVIGLAVLLLGDELTAVQAGGAAVVLAGAVLAAAEDRGAARDAAASGGPRLAALASVAFGIYLFGLVVLVDELGWLLPILLTRAGGIVVLLALVRRRPDTTLLRGRALALATAVGGLEVLGYALFNYGAERGDAAVTAAAASAYPVVPAVFGVLVLDEHLARHQVAGVGAVLGGMVLLSLG